MHYDLKTVRRKSDVHPNFVLRILCFITVSSLFLYSYLIYKYIQIAQFENGSFAYETVLGL